MTNSDYRLGDRVQILLKNSVYIPFRGLIGVIVEIDGENVKLLMDNNNIIMDGKSTPNPIWGNKKDICRVGALEVTKRIILHKLIQ